jgi:hypothetical protein
MSTPIKRNFKCHSTDAIVSGRSIKKARSMPSHTEANGRLPNVLFSCTRRRLTSPPADYHLSSACHWAAAAHNPLPRSPSAADKQEMQHSCSASPNLQRLQHIATISNLSDAHISSRATLYYLACIGREAWPLAHCPFPGGGYGGSRYFVFTPRCWNTLFDSIGLDYQQS